MQSKQTDTTTYRAYTNIALIKYWGKRNNELFLPMTSSLSLTLDQFYTETSLAWNHDSKKDTFTLDGQKQDDAATEKVSHFIDMFRNLSGIQKPVHVTSYNHVPTAAGLASSASAFAALASVCNDFFDTKLSDKELSTYARQGSGSATRSLFGGFTLWHKGVGDQSETSYAEMIDPADWDLGMVVVMINKQQKKISSRVGMEHTIETSPFYQLWPQTVEVDLKAILPAIKEKDFKKVGAIAEHNAMKMHATIIAANPSMTYWEPETITAMNIVRELRDSGIDCYFTIDAGPNVKVLCRLSQADIVKDAFKAHFAEDRLVTTGPGKAPHKIN